MSIGSSVLHYLEEKGKRESTVFRLGGRVVRGLRAGGTCLLAFAEEKKKKEVEARDRVRGRGKEYNADRSKPPSASYTTHSRTTGREKGRLHPPRRPCRHPSALLSIAFDAGLRSAVEEKRKEPWVLIHTSALDGRIGPLGRGGGKGSLSAEEEQEELCVLLMALTSGVLNRRLVRKREGEMTLVHVLYLGGKKGKLREMGAGQVFIKVLTASLHHSQKEMTVISRQVVGKKGHGQVFVVAAAL